MLHGTFETLTISELLRMLTRAGKSASVHLVAGGVEAHVHLVDGRCGAVTWGDAVAPLDDAHDLEGRLADACFAIASQPGGEFDVTDDAVTSWRAGIDVEPALQAAERRLAEWHDIQSVIPSLDAHPSLRDELGSESLTLDPALWRLLVAIDGHRSVREVIDRTHRDVLEVCHALKTLVESGAVVFDVVLDAPVSAPKRVRAKSSPVPVAPAEPPVPALPATEPRGHGAELTEPWGPDVEAAAAQRFARAAGVELGAGVLVGDDPGVRDRRALLRLFSALRES